MCTLVQCVTNNKNAVPKLGPIVFNKLPYIVIKKHWIQEEISVALGTFHFD